MKKIVLIISFLFSIIISTLNAQVLLNEQFNYPVGDSLTQYGWTVHSGGATNYLSCTSGSLSYLGYSIPAGNKVFINYTGQDASRTFTAQPAGTNLYVGFLINVTSALTTAEYFIHLKGASATVFYGRVYIQKDITLNKYRIGILKGSTAANIVYGSTLYDFGTTNLLVLKYSIKTGSANDSVALFVNPSTTVEGIPTITASDITSTDIDLTSQAVALRQGSSINGLNLYVDEICVATNWSDMIGTLVTAAPTLQTLAANNITLTAATCNANVTSDGGTAITQRGICYSTSPNPDTSNAKVIVAGATGNFFANITGLTSNTTYHYRAYAINTYGITYGADLTFTTLSKTLHLKLYLEALFNADALVMNKTQDENGDYFAGNIVDNISVEITEPNPPFNTLASFNAELNTTGNATIKIPEQYNSNYFITVKHRNSVETWSSTAINFSNDSIFYDFSIDSTKSFSDNLKRLSYLKYGIYAGDLNQDGMVNIFDLTDVFDMILDPNAPYGYLPEDLNGDGTINIFDLIMVFDNVIIGASALNPVSLGIDYPQGITTTTATNLTGTNATSGGTIQYDGGSPITARGVCWSISHNPTLANNFTTNGIGTGSFTSNIISLTPDSMYYVRSYATNIAGTIYGNEVNIRFFPIFDIDGNGYDTVVIGTQTWIKQNLNVTHYRNGDIIPKITDNTVWSTLTSGAYSDYVNDSNYSKIYGRLYNFYSVVDNRNLCPNGWHVPSDAEWTTLTSYLGGESISGGKLKEIGTTHWINPNTGATNETGFSALPTGTRYSDGNYGFLGNNGLWWSSTIYDPFYIWYRLASNDNTSFHRTYFGKNYGLNVRCLIGEFPTLGATNTTNISQNELSVIGNVVYDGGLPILARGVCWSSYPNPILANNHTIDSSGIGSFTSKIISLSNNSTYYIRTYATNSAGTSYGDEQILTTLKSSFVDYDENGYDTVHIGTQIWMKQNLKTTHYRNGDIIPNTTDNASWSNLTSGSYCNYNNDTIYNATYGRLYNFYSVTDSRKLCPTGWHAPSDSEWVILTTYLGGESVASNKLKEAGQLHWINYNGTNESGFSAIPGGNRAFSDGVFNNLGLHCYFWSSTEYYVSDAWSRGLDYYNSNIYISTDNKKNGMSVRCLKGDLPILSTTNVTGATQNTATSGGNISNDGGLPIIARGVCWSTNYNPTLINNFTTDSIGIGSFYSNLTNLTPSTTYYIRAYATNSFGTSFGNELIFTTIPFPVYDIDGNGYDTVVIGSQTWLKQNLKTTKYRNGNAITIFTDSIAWSNLTTGAYCNYNNDTNNSTIYGRLYNFYTIADTSKLCPTGWHVPTDAEWTILTSYLGVYEVGGKLKETGLSHWNSPNTAATNEVGFTALPAGSREVSGIYSGIGVAGCWWSSTIDNTSVAWCLVVLNNYSNAFMVNNDKQWGFSVRCLKGEAPLIIGQSYQGGTIAYILQPADSGYDANIQHGLIIGPSYQDIAFYNIPRDIQKCTDLVLNGYDDWYMPNIDQLWYFYLHRTTIGGFDPNAPYVTSSIVGYQYWSVNFSTGQKVLINSFPVNMADICYRPIRNF